jgi:twinkle protein
MTISALHIKWLESRAISVEVATNMGVYSARPDQAGQCVQDPDGNIIVFPFLMDGEQVGAKYRGPQKRFWQAPGGRKQFFNRDVLLDPALADNPLVIVEGEMDALAVATAGYPWVVSVPDGAPPARDAEGRLIDVPEDTKDIDPNSDTKFAFLLTDWTLLSNIRRIIIATDNDEPGRRLAAELVRRLDRVRCSFITLPDGCKDLNEVLSEHGPDAVLGAIQAAKPYPVEGIYRASDFPPEQALQTFSTGWKSVDETMRPYLSCFMVVGGFPGHGKSTWTMQLATNMAALHGWSIAIASFEMQIVPYVTNTIMGTFLGKNIKNAIGLERSRAQAFLEKRFVFIAPNRQNSEIEYDIDWLIDKMQTAVIREGVRMILIDPFNEIEHRKRHDESMTEYIGRAIRKLKAFAMQFEVLVVVVVHPTKASSQMDSADLSLYSLADSSHWANKADIGVIVGRIGDPRIDSLTGIYIKKIRYQPDAGAIGQVTLDFNRDTRLFVE